MRVIGLMSGTSLDGIDAALVEFDGDTPDALSWRLVAFDSVEYSAEQRELLHDAMVSGGPAELCSAHALIGEWFAAAALRVCERAGIVASDVDVIGSHGQTVWHRPPSAGARGATLQLGDAATIAERTGVPVVSDFRSRDVAAGGEGAPLVPWIDRVLFAAEGHTRVMQNIGGIANLTCVPPRGDAAPLVAFDTGPGNVLIDAAVQRATNGAQAYDRDGMIAARGTVDTTLLEQLLAHEYFSLRPPKSTGRELFGRAFVDRIIEERGTTGDAAFADLIATLTAFTAHSIADALRRWLADRDVRELVVTGGGARNPVLMRMLQEQLHGVAVRTGEDIGIDSDAKEATAFAALAWAHVHRVPGNVPEATGSEGPRVLGSFTPGGAAHLLRLTIQKP